MTNLKMVNRDGIEKNFRFVTRAALELLRRAGWTPVEACEFA